MTHDPLGALSLADHLVLIEAGRLIQGGAPQEVIGEQQVDVAGTIDARVSPAGPFALVAEVMTTAVAELRLEVGQELWATVKAAEVRIYPA